MRRAARFARAGAALLTRWAVRAGAAALLVSLLWGDRPYELDLLSHFAQHCAALVALLAGVALAARRWRRAAEWSVWAAVVFGVSLAPRVSTAAARADGGAPGRLVLRVISYNAKWTRAHDDAAFHAWLREQDADLIALFDPPWTMLARDQWLRDTYPHRVEPERGARWLNVLLSKREARVDRIGERSVLTQRSFVARRSMTITLDDGSTLLFAGMRPPSPRTRGFWRDSLHEARRDGGVLRGFIEETGVMVIVPGDFNSTPTGRVHREFARASGLRAWTTPVGGGTWPSWAPPLLALPIDRVWVSDGLRIVSAAVGPNFGSDHRPVVFDIELPVSAPANPPEASGEGPDAV